MRIVHLPTLLSAALAALSLHIAPARAAADDYAITVEQPADVAAKRRRLIEFIWGTEGFPTAASELAARGVDSPVRALANLERVDELRVTMPRSSGAPVVVGAYHFIPARKQNRLVVLVDGHGCPATFAEDGKGYGLEQTIRALVHEGFGVAAVYMPLQSDEQCEPGKHAEVFGTAPPGRNGLAFFLEPTARVINHLAAGQPEYRDFSMIGFSGGGWTTTVYAALDPRIALSIPIAGSVPLYLRKEKYSHDEEQIHAAFYALAGYPDLYVLGAAGAGRMQIQVLNRDDPCCFSATHHDPTLPRLAALPAAERGFAPAVHAYEARVRAALATIGAGSFHVEIVEGSRHTISADTISNVILPALKPEPARAAAPTNYPAPAEGDFLIRDFVFASGEKLPELRLHYRTLGKPRRDAQGVVRNAVWIGHGTGGSGAQFLRPEFAGALFGPGQLLDANRYFIVLPDGIGHGQSSKPSDGLHAKFPQYGYTDMVEAQYRLLSEGLKVNHLRLVMGTSMGGMHTWVWGERHPDFMDALMPLASLPGQISGRNRVWRKAIIDGIRNDPEWKGGEYTSQPPSLRTANALIYFMGSNPRLRQEQMPTLTKADVVLDAALSASMANTDANDVLYQIGASRDYDPAPALETIRAPLIAVNSADDLINPPELGILEREIVRVKNGSAVVIPLSKDTRGHGSHTVAALWKDQLAKLLQNTERR